jgi:hypothetical protein
MYLLRRYERRDGDRHGKEDEGSKHPAKPPCPFLDRRRSRPRMPDGARGTSAPVDALYVANDLVEREVWVMEGRMDHAIPIS